MCQLNTTQLSDRVHHRSKYVGVRTLSELTTITAVTADRISVNSTKLPRCELAHVPCKVHELKHTGRETIFVWNPKALELSAVTAPVNRHNQNLSGLDFLQKDQNDSMEAKRGYIKANRSVSLQSATVY